MTIPPKPAPTDLPILDSIKNRWSPFAFSDQKIEQQDIDTLFEAARWAPSSFNEQPWRYVYATKDDGEDRVKMESLLMEGNSWAKDAYLLIVDFAKKTYTKNGKENGAAEHDLGASNAFLVLQLSALGLVGHQMGGFEKAKANELLGVPDDYKTVSMIAVGYPGDLSSLPESLQERQNAPRSRLATSEIVHRGRWSA